MTTGVRGELQLRARVQELARNLEVAIADRRAEVDAPPLLLCDADVVLGMVLGFFGERLGARMSPGDADRRVVRSALNLGALGTISMLDAHATELIEHVRADHDRRFDGEGVFRKAVLRYVDREGIRPTLDRLRAAIPPAGVSEADLEIARNRFVNELTGSGDRVFAAIEHLHGHWKTRFRRAVGSVLDLSGAGDPVERTLAGGRGLVSALMAWLRRRRPRRERQNLRDAVAIASLIQLNRTTDRPLRFYTETAVLQDLFEASEWSGSLRDAAGRPLLRRRGVLFLRAGLPTLRPGGPFDAAGVDHLAGVLAEARALLAQDSADFGLRLTVDGQGVRALLDHFERDPLVATFVTSTHLPSTLMADPASWTAVYAFARDMGPLLVDHIGDVVDDLARELGHLRRWLEGVDRLGALVKRLAAAAPRMAEEPARDLALVRWGAPRDGEGVVSASALLGRILDPDARPAAREGALMDVADLAVAPTSEADAEAMVHVYWGLRAWEDLAAFVDGLPDPLSTPAIRLCRLAAALKGSDPGEARLRAGVAEAEAVWAGLPDEATRARHALGYGYVLYHAWQWGRELPGLEETARTWALRSYDVVQAARMVGAADSLVRVFQLNHLVYVGLQCGVGAPAEIEALVEQLLRYRGGPDWSPRVSDTVALYYLTEARTRLDVGPPGDARVLRLAERAIELAEDLLADTRDTSRDYPVDVHLHLLGRLQARLVEAQRAAGVEPQPGSPPARTRPPRARIRRVKRGA